MHNLKNLLFTVLALAGLIAFVWVAGPFIWDFFDSGNFLDGDEVSRVALVVGVSTVGAVLIAWLKKRR